MRKEIFILGLLILSFMSPPVLGITIPGTEERFSTTIHESNIQIPESIIQPQFPNQGESGGIKQWIWQHLPDSIKNRLPSFIKNFLKPNKETPQTPEEVTPKKVTLAETPLKPPKISAIIVVRMDDLIDEVELLLFQMQEDLAGKLDTPNWEKEITLSGESEWRLDEATGEYKLLLDANECPIIANFKPGETIPYEGAVFLYNKEVVDFTYNYEEGKYSFNSLTLTKLSLIDGVKLPLFQMQEDLAGKFDTPNWQKEIDFSEESDWKQDETTGEYTLFLTANECPIIANFKPGETIPYEGAVFLYNKDVVDFTYDYERKEYEYSY